MGINRIKATAFTVAAIGAALLPNKAEAGFERKVVCEEITGTWCIYCPSGIVAIEEIKEEYGDIFIPIAVHYEDVMTDKDYTVKIMDAVGSVGAPYAFTMRSRKYSGSVSDLKTRVAYLTLSEASAMIKIEAEYDDEGIINVSGNLASDITLNEGEWSVELVLTEDDVYHPGESKYNQRNAYAGSEFPMGGFELLPDPVPSEEMHYNDVARGIISIDSQSLPPLIPEGETEDFVCTMPKPASVDTIRNCSLTALLLDSKGAVINADRCKIKIKDNSDVKELIEERTVVRSYDLMGRNVSPSYRGIVIEVLDDGTCRKARRL